MDYEPLERILPMTYPSTHIFAGTSETALFQESYNTPLEPRQSPSQLWKESLCSLLVKV